MSNTSTLIVVLFLFSNVIAKPIPKGGKACEIFNSFYNEDLGGLFAKSRDFTSPDPDFASILAREGFESNQIKYRIAIRNNCLIHVETMERQYESKSDDHKRIIQKESVSPDSLFIDDQINPKSSVLTGDGWNLVQNWRKLTREMTTDEVRNLLGEPLSVDGGVFTTWKYPNDGTVYFYKEKVDRWREPRD